MSLTIDRDAIAAVCRAHGVMRLQLFGSATRDTFDEHTSDVDLLVELDPNVANAFDAYFDLKESLEQLLGREVDLVMSSALRNPFVIEELRSTAVDLYAA